MVDLSVTDLANVLFLFVLRPHHIVHLIQSLSALFVRLQLHLAVLKGCLKKEKKTSKTTLKNCFSYEQPIRVSHRFFTAALLTSSFFWLDCRMHSFSFLSSSCSSCREFILSVAAVS